MDLRRLAESADQGATLIIRTDFTNDVAWQKVVDELSRPVDFGEDEASVDDEDDTFPGDAENTPNDEDDREDEQAEGDEAIDVVVEGSLPTHLREFGDSGPAQDGLEHVELVSMSAEEVRREFAMLEAQGVLLPDFDDDEDLQIEVDDYEGYEIPLEPVEDGAFKGLTGEEIGRRFSRADLTAGYALVVDARSIAEAVAGSELTVAFVDLATSDPEDMELLGSHMGNTFRTLVTEVASIEANLSIANMDFCDVADSTDGDGVFRGFEGE